MSTLRPEQNFKVVVNHEEQYSIWPTSRPNPSGWRDAGAAGTPETCISFIERATIDSSPRKLRELIESLSR